jgi:hypothetical protein
MKDSVVYLRKAKTVGPEKQPSQAIGSETTIASRQCLDKHVHPTADKPATMEVLLKMVFSS